MQQHPHTRAITNGTDTSASLCLPLQEMEERMASLSVRVTSGVLPPWAN